MPPHRSCRKRRRLAFFLYAHCVRSPFPIGTGHTQQGEGGPKGLRELSGISSLCSDSSARFRRAAPSDIPARLRRGVAISYQKSSAQVNLAELFCYLLAESEGFEPPEACTSTVFKTAALNHSANSPRQEHNLKTAKLRANREKNKFICFSEVQPLLPRSGT